jgi:hypothetical protein
MSSFFDEVNAIVAKNKAKAAAEKEHQSPSSPHSSNSSPPSSSRVSVVDILPPSSTTTTTTTTERSIDAYDEYSYDKYYDLLGETMDGPRFLRKNTRSPLDDDQAASVIQWLQAEEPVVPINLPTLQSAWKKGNNSDNDNDNEDSTTSSQDTSKRFRNELLNQRNLLMEHYGWNDKQYSVAVGALTNMGNLCAKRATGPPLEVAWPKLKEAGYRMDKDTLHVFLYVSSTFSSLSSSRYNQKTTRNRKHSVGSFLDDISNYNSPSTTIHSTTKNKSVVSNHPNTSKADEEEDDWIDVTTEVALCHDILFEPTEQSTSIRVRMLVSQGKAKEAEILLDSSMVSLFWL